MTVWVVLGLAGLAADLHSGALAGVFVSAAAVAAALAGAAGLPPAAQAAAFVSLAAASLVLLRPLLLRHTAAERTRPELLLGKLGSVLDAVDEHLASGRVVIEGVPYVARGAHGAAPLAVGAAIRVRAVEAGDIIVERL